MKKVIMLLVGVVCLTMCASSADAVVVFEDDFEDYAGGTHTASLTKIGDNAPTWFIADNKNVDIIGVGTPWPSIYPASGYGKMVDLDGSTGGVDLSTFGPLAAGEYILSFDLAGNQRNTILDDVTVSVSLAGFSETFSLSKNTPFTTFSRAFTLGSAGSATLLFSHTGIGDNTGMLLDNVKLETVPVPEPATMVLLGSSMVGLFLKRKRKA